MRLRITKTTPGSYDRTNVRRYKAGEEHDVPSEFMDEHLARDFLSIPVAEVVEDQAAEEKESDAPIHGADVPGPEETKPGGPEEAKPSGAEQTKPTRRSRRKK